MKAADVQEAVTRARDAISVQRVFGEPYERNGVTVIPAARIWGGGGGGLQEGHEGPGPGAGFGSGFGMLGRPAGAFVLKGDTVRWQPAVDPNVIVPAVLLVLLGVLRAARRRRRRRRWEQRRWEQRQWEQRRTVPPAGEERPETPAGPGPSRAGG